ncbi:hypothetical protein SprV_0401667500 [Sparganum proliferum]
MSKERLAGFKRFRSTAPTSNPTQRLHPVNEHFDVVEHHRIRCNNNPTNPPAASTNAPPLVTPAPFSTRATATTGDEPMPPPTRSTTITSIVPITALSTTTATSSTPTAGGNTSTPRQASKSIVVLSNATTTNLRGHPLKLRVTGAKLDIRKFFFSNTVIEAWNALPTDVAMSTSVEAFKRKLDQCTTTRHNVT